MTRPASVINPDQALDLVVDVWLRYCVEIQSRRLGQVIPAAPNLEKEMLSGNPECRQTAIDIRIGAARILDALDKARVLKEDF